MQEHALPEVYSEGNAAYIFFVVFAKFQKAWNECNWEIVYAVESDVLEDMDCGAFARSRQPGDDNNVHNCHILGNDPYLRFLKLAILLRDQLV